MRLSCFLICICVYFSGSLFALKTKNTVPEYKLIGKSDYRTLVISIYKNVRFKGDGLEILFKVSCIDRKKKASREFYIKKVDQALKEKIVANYALTEQTSKNEKLIYPFGWENEKINLKDIKDNCILIIENKINPI